MADDQLLTLGGMLLGAPGAPRVVPSDYVMLRNEIWDFRFETDKRLAALEQQAEGHFHGLRALIQPVVDWIRGLRREWPLELLNHCKEVSIRHYHGMCPRCNEQRVVENGQLTAEAEKDHFYSRSQIKWYEVWLLCKPCHSQKTNCKTLDEREAIDAVHTAYNKRIFTDQYFRVRLGLDDWSRQGSLF